jgi:hypothetical protein
MIHYHGLPITPTTAALTSINGGHAFVSFRHKDQWQLAVEVCQSYAVDNGAFSAWTAGEAVIDWEPYYEWAHECMVTPNCDFAVIPDVIDGDEIANDKLLDEWPLPKWFGAPVWHMHESLERLARLSAEWPRVCIGSSGDFSTVGNAIWWQRIGDAMSHCCNVAGQPLCKLHGMRMLNPSVFTKLPFASADSTNIGRSIGIDKKWSNGNYLPPTKEARAAVMRSRIESQNSPSKWAFSNQQELDLCISQ